MEKNNLFLKQEIVLGNKNPVISSQISKLVKANKIRKIAPRIYTSNFTEPVEIIIRRNIFQILGELYPNILLSHRSAFEFQPTQSGHLFLTTSYTKKVKLPGITLQFIEGFPPIQGDNLFTGRLFVSQKARAFLENLQINKKIGSESKCLSLPELEEKLEQIIRVHGENEINNLRDLAREISNELGFQKEFEKLNRIISALLSTKTSKILTSSIAKARAFGLPYDPNRINLFESLFRSLQAQEFHSFPEPNLSLTQFRNFAFFESYFSNYIEGTIFEVEEAKKIVEFNKPLPSRNEDSHDILGTYQIVSNKKEMSITPNSANEFLEILKYRHAILLSARLDKKPGVFKNKNNFAGSTSFVDFNLVRGTLIKSFDYYQLLENPFARAAYIMFVVSEIHPFLDGNGRIARVMMNAELVSGNNCKIIIPTVYREDYIGALKKLTKHHMSETYINMLKRAHLFSSNLFDENIEKIQEYLKKCNAFSDDSSTILKIVSRDS